MRATAVILGLLFGGIIVAVDSQAPGGPGVLIGTIGIAAGLLTWMHPRAGFVAFAVAVVLSLLSMLGDWGYLVYAMMFAVPAWLAKRSADRNRAAAERAERMDRYVRGQLGE